LRADSAELFLWRLVVEMWICEVGIIANLWK